MGEEMSEESSVQTKKSLMSALGGFIAGMVVTAVLVVTLMPSMMIIKHRSKYDVEKTVQELTAAIEEQGWVHSGTKNMNKGLAKQGKTLKPLVRLVALCHPEYAKSVLSTDRYVSCLMPCKIAVYEGDDGQVYISKMNTGLMGKLFGGNIARVMGGSVAQDEHEILKSVIKP